MFSPVSNVFYYISNELMRSGVNGCMCVQRVRSRLVRVRLAALVTWLIMPVVIRLSQRLRRASLSIGICTVKLGEIKNSLSLSLPEPKNTGSYERVYVFQA